MRWNKYCCDEWNIESENLGDYSYDMLCEMCKHAKEYYFDLHDSEPSSKSQNEEIHRVWEAQCLQVIKDISEIDNMISDKLDMDEEILTRIECEDSGMSYEDLMKELELHEAMREAYQRGEIDDGWSDECRQNWIEKCNA